MTTLYEDIQQIIMDLQIYRDIDGFYIDASTYGMIGLNTQI
jgi:hypothetical protein